MTTDEIRAILNNESNRLYNPTLQHIPNELPAFPKHIEDPEQSVNWNKSFVEQHNETRKRIIQQNIRARENIDNLFENDLADALRTTYNLSVEQVDIILNLAKTRTSGIRQTTRYRAMLDEAEHIVKLYLSLKASDYDRNRITINTPLGNIVAYTLPDPDNPGIGLDLQRENGYAAMNLAVVECNNHENEEPPTLVAHIWSDAQQEDSTTDEYYKNIETYFDRLKYVEDSHKED